MERAAKKEQVVAQVPCETMLKPPCARRIVFGNIAVVWIVQVGGRRGGHFRCVTVSEG